jgi:hypothetical protein
MRDCCAVTEDLRNINKQAPAKSTSGAAGGMRKEKNSSWLLKGKPVEVTHISN